MYPILLSLHNIMRWLVVIAGIWLLIRTYMGLFSKSDWTDTEGKAVRFFVIFLDVQLVLGLILYFVSPLIQAAMSDMGAAMGDDQLRFFSVEHFSMMILAVILAHIGSVMVKRAAESRSKYIRSAIWFTIAALIIVAAIPWWRPMFPALSL
jgi:hypothetical protein